MLESENIWLAVVNLHAGNGKTMEIWHSISDLITEAGLNYEEKFTDAQYHATEIAYRAASEGHRRFMVAGGDGTIHEVLDGIMQFIEESQALDTAPAPLEEFYLAAFPVGSGNDWIRLHGISSDWRESISLIQAGSFVKQDVVKVSLLSPGSEPAGTAQACPPPIRTSHLINIAGVGFDARVCERVNAQKDRGRKGKLLYINSLIYNLFHYEHRPMRILADGVEVMNGKCLSLAIGTGKYSGGGMRQTPEAIYDDGLLDFTIIPSFPIPRILVEASKLFTGKILNVKELVHGRCKSLAVFPADGQAGEPVEADGEIIGHSPVRFDVLPWQINVLHRP